MQRQMAAGIVYRDPPPPRRRDAANAATPVVHNTNVAGSGTDVKLALPGERMPTFLPLESRNCARRLTSEVSLNAAAPARSTRNSHVNVCPGRTAPKLVGSFGPLCAQTDWLWPVSPSQLPALALMLSQYTAHGAPPPGASSSVGLIS